MIRPVERFAVNVNGPRVSDDVLSLRPAAPPSGPGALGLAAAACLGAAAVLAAQRLLDAGQLRPAVDSLRALLGF